MEKGARDNIPPWRETPLDHWSTEIDPALMAGDEWAEGGADADPGTEWIDERQGRAMSGAPFMHPTHDTNYGLEYDQFNSEGEH